MSHLHYGTTKNGTWVDPNSVLKGTRDSTKEIVSETIKRNTEQYDTAKEQADQFFDDLDTLIKIRNEELPGLSSDWVNLEGMQEELKGKILDIEFEAFDKQLENISESIQKIDDKMMNFDETQYSDKILWTNNKIRQLTKSTVALDDEINTLKSLTPKTSTEISKITLRIQELQERVYQNTLTFKEYRKAIEETTKAYKDYYKQILEEQTSEAEKLIDSYFNTVIKGLKSEVAEYEDTQRRSEVIYGDKIDLFQKQIKEIEEAYDLETKALTKTEALQEDKNDELEKELDYRKKLADLLEDQAKKQQELDNIQKEKNTRIYREDIGKFVYEAKESDITKAKEDLADIDEKIDELKVDRAKEVAEKLKETKKEQISDERRIRKEAQIKELEDEIERFENLKDAMNDRFDEKIDNLNKFIETEQDKYESSHTLQIETLDQLYARLSELDREAFKDRLEDLSTFVSSYNTEYSKLHTKGYVAESGETISEPEPLTGTPIQADTSSNLVNLDQTFREYAEQKGFKIGWDDSSKSVLIDGKLVPNQTMRRSGLINVDGSYMGNTKDYDSLLYNTTGLISGRQAPPQEAPIASFANEGYTGTWNSDYGKLAMVHPKEWILKDSTVSDIISGDIYNNMSSRLNPENITNKQTNTSNDIYIENLTVKSDTPEDFPNKLRRMAIRSQ